MATYMYSRMLNLPSRDKFLHEVVNNFEYQSARLDSNNNNKLVSKTFVLFFIVCLQSCQADLVKDNGHKYFLSVLADAYMRVSHIQRHPFIVCIYRPQF